MCTHTTLHYHSICTIQQVFPVWDYPVVREYIGAATGGKVSFPALELAPGNIMLESQDIIDHFAKQEGVDVDKMWISKYYNETIFKNFTAMFKRLVTETGDYGEFHKWLEENAGATGRPDMPEGKAASLV